MNQSIDISLLNTNIVSALDKIITIYRVLHWDITKTENLSPIQIQFIEFIHQNPRELCTLTKLADEFELTKATVSDSINNLFSKGYIKKYRDSSDSRIYYFELTEKGASVISLIKTSKKDILDLVENLSLEQKMIISGFLQNLIFIFHQNGKIRQFKSCLTCFNFVRNANPLSEKPHFCAFAKIYMADPELKTYCAIHKDKSQKSKATQ